MEQNKIYNEDCLDTMNRMEDNCIDLTVTSPPYDNLRDYKGYTFDFESIAKELFRVTKDGGVVVWVVGDTTKNFCESLSSFRQATYFVKECGFKLLDTMIYYKQNYAPAYPTLRRYANQFEYMFIFSKGRPSTFNPVMVDKVENRNGWSGFRQKDGSVKRKIVKTIGDKKQASNVWSYPVGFKNLGHPAVFPEQLANDHIISWSNENDIVYDPFMGSGTTAKMAIKNKRNWIGSEMSAEYCDIIKERLLNEQLKQEMKGKGV